MATSIPLASAEMWAPSISAGEKPDLEKIRREARDLMERGRYEEALQRHIWYHNHALEYEPALSGVRLSFLLSDWIELGRRYPKAKQALIEIRDAKTREFAAGGYAELFQDVASINSYLQDNDATLKLFKEIDQRDPALARQCYFYAERLLVERGEYELCLKCLGDPQARFDVIRLGWELQSRQNLPTRSASLPPGATPPRNPASLSYNHFIQQVRTLIEILAVTGHQAEAEKIHAQAILILDDARLMSALSDAEAKIRSRAASVERK